MLADSYTSNHLGELLHDFVQSCRFDEAQSIFAIESHPIHLANKYASLVVVSIGYLLS